MPVCVCPNKSDRHIRAYFFCGASACSRFQASFQVRGRFSFLMQFPHLGDVPFNLSLVTLTSILRLPDGASGGHSRSAAKVTPGFAEMQGQASCLREISSYGRYFPFKNLCISESLP